MAKANNNGFTNNIPSRKLNTTNQNKDSNFNNEHEAILIKFFQAITKHKYEEAERIIKLMPNINAKNSHGYTPLLLAIDESNTLNIVTKLLESGADPDISDKKGSTALHFAVWANKIKKIENLLSFNANPNIANSSNLTPIHGAIEYGSKALKLLLSKGANPNVPKGPNVLALAIQKNNLEALKLLISNGAFPQKDMLGELSFRWYTLVPFKNREIYYLFLAYKIYIYDFTLEEFTAELNKHNNIKFSIELNNFLLNGKSVKDLYETLQRFQFEEKYKDIFSLDLKNIWRAVDNLENIQLKELAKNNILKILNLMKKEIENGNANAAEYAVNKITNSLMVINAICRNPNLVSYIEEKNISLPPEIVSLIASKLGNINYETADRILKENKESFRKKIEEINPSINREKE
ncbi:MAG: ankyrin repeat domain-containing protein [Sphingobacteriia bacterium]|nr:ankyrin repeat domain-containing protein [Sphingobacteriia bacterium]